jgi:hypothetical protein
MEDVNEASLEHFVESNQEDVTEFFIEEEEENPTESEPLDETEEPSRPPIELKPLPPGLRYAFLHNDSESPVIINNQLTQEETHRLITVLERHRSAFGYSLQDLKGISPALCTHRVPTDPDVLPSGSHKSSIKMFEEIIFPRFGTPRLLISDGGSHFIDKHFEKYLMNHGIQHNVATPYHPQTSGQAETSNK